jgi:hypothetical protein
MDVGREKRHALEEKEAAAYQQVKRSTYARPVRNATAYGLRKLRTRSATKKIATKAKVSTANAWINGWVGLFYLTIQLPFAIFSSVGLGVGVYVYSLIENNLGEGVANFIVQSIGEGFNTFTGAVLTATLSLFGLDFNPLLLFLVPFLIIFTLGILQLVSAWFVYSVSGIRSLSGQSAAAKQATFILASIGLFIPVLNLLPLTSIWTAVVWWRPN